MAARRESNGAARRGLVLIDRQPAGWIEETRTGMKFTYARQWLQRPDARPVSLTMPLTAESYSVEGVHPFFENLLPEGWLLNIAVGKLKLARGDGFGLLLALCRDCVGAVSIEPWPEDEAPVPADG